MGWPGIGNRGGSHRRLWEHRGGNRGCGLGRAEWWHGCRCRISVGWRCCGGRDRTCTRGRGRRIGAVDGESGRSAGAEHSVGAHDQRDDHRGAESQGGTRGGDLPRRSLNVEQHDLVVTAAHHEIVAGMDGSVVGGLRVDRAAEASQRRRRGGFGQHRCRAFGSADLRIERYLDHGIDLGKGGRGERGRCDDECCDRRPNMCPPTDARQRGTAPLHCSRSCPLQASDARTFVGNPYDHRDRQRRPTSSDASATPEGNPT